MKITPKQVQSLHALVYSNPPFNYGPEPSCFDEDEGAPMKSHELLRTAWSRQYNAKGGNLQTNPFRKAQLARRLEVSEGTVGRWLAGERQPNLEHATRLAEMLKMDIREYWLARMAEVEERWKEEGR